jgi:prolyl-tRNA editing enzyme YbaK/EbsC (Cys-tRNA(Pro) deacylase)
VLPDKVRAVLEAHGLTALEFEPGSTPTAESAARRIGVEVGQIAKSLLFRDRAGRHHLVVCAGDVKVSSSKLKRRLGSSAMMASGEEAVRITGFAPGAVCPFGVVDVPIYVDESLRRFTTIYPAAGTDSSGVPMTYEKLLAITGAQPCDVTASRAPAAGEA